MKEIISNENYTLAKHPAIDVVITDTPHWYGIHHNIHINEAMPVHAFDVVYNLCSGESDKGGVFTISCFQPNVDAVDSGIGLVITEPLVKVHLLCPFITGITKRECVDKVANMIADLLLAYDALNAYQLSAFFPNLFDAEGKLHED